MDSPESRDSILSQALLLLPAYGALGSDEAKKISPLLKQEVDFLVENPRFDYSIPLIVQVRPALFERQAAARQGRAQRSDNSLAAVNGYRARLTAAQIIYLLKSPLVEYVTLDAVIRPSKDKGRRDHDGKEDQDGSEVARSAIGVDQLRGYDGEGVVVAVFDSGIDVHDDLDKDNRIRASVDFTSGKAKSRDRGKDEFGHGTHVAGIIGGDGGRSSKKISGVATRVEFVDLQYSDSTSFATSFEGDN